MSTMTTISVERETRERLKQLGSKGESYNHILNRLIDRYIEMQHGKVEEEKEKFEELKDL